jgi:hypothetical protein
MRLCHTTPFAAARFDERNLVSASGLVPVMRLAADAGLRELAGNLLTVPTDKGANAGGKVTALVCGIVAGADSIEDMALLRHGAMGRLFDRSYASMLGSFLREFSFGHVRQLDAVASRFLAALAGRTELLTGGPAGMVLVDVDDSIIEVHGHAKRGASFGYTAGPRPEHAARDRQHPRGCTGGGRAACAQRLVRFTARRKAPGRRRSEDRPLPAARRNNGIGCWCGGLRLLRQPHHRRGGPGRRAGVGHRPDDPKHQGGERQHRRRRFDHDRLHRRDPGRGHR